VASSLDSSLWTLVKGEHVTDVPLTGNLTVHNGGSSKLVDDVRGEGNLAEVNAIEQDY
jgi:hypothetical protein